MQTKVTIPEETEDAYQKLCIGGFYTYGLELFLRRGMLEWLMAFAEPAIKMPHKHESLESAEIRHNELITLMTNMMEAGCNRT